MSVGRNSFVNLRIFLVELVLVAEELLEVVHIIDSEVIKLYFISLVAIGTDI